MLCKHEVVGSIPSGSTKSEALRQSQETTSFGCRASMRVCGSIDIVKEGFDAVRCTAPPVEA